MCVCTFVCSCLHTGNDLQQSSFNKIRVKSLLTGASACVTQDCQCPGKCFVLELQLHTVTLAASTAGDLEFHSAVTLTKKRRMILMVIEDIL